MHSNETAFNMKLQKTLLLTCFIAFSNPVLAADDDSDSDIKKADRYDPTYSAIRLTSVTTDFDNIDRAINLGFTLGVHIPGVNFLSAEIDISSTLIPGENKGSGSAPVATPTCDLACQLAGGNGGGGGGGASSANNSNSSSDLRMNSVGIFAVGRTPGQFFGTARIGYRFLQTSLSDLDEDQTGSALGLGLGYQYGESGGVVELTYTQYGSNVNYLSLAISY
jgi:hypothetical protein